MQNNVFFRIEALVLFLVDTFLGAFYAIPLYYNLGWEGIDIEGVDSLFLDLGNI